MAADRSAPPSETQPVDLADDSDEALVALARGEDGGAPDSSAFAALVHRYSGRLYGLAQGMLRNEQDARDVVQETFLQVHRRLDGFRGEASFKTWLFRIATNGALMKLRRRRRKPETTLELPELDAADPTSAAGRSAPRELSDPRPLADQVHEQAELGARIRAAVDALPEGYRQVLILADYQHLSMQEIARALELTVPNVKTRLHRARLAVRATLQEYLAGRV